MFGRNLYDLLYDGYSHIQVPPCKFIKGCIVVEYTGTTHTVHEKQSEKPAGVRRIRADSEGLIKGL